MPTLYFILMEAAKLSFCWFVNNIKAPKDLSSGFFVKNTKYQLIKLQEYTKTVKPNFPPKEMILIEFHLIEFQQGPIVICTGISYTSRKKWDFR